MKVIAICSPRPMKRWHRVLRIIELSLHPRLALKPVCQSWRWFSEQGSMRASNMWDKILYSWFSSPIHLYLLGSLGDPLFLNNILNFTYAILLDTHSLSQTNFMKWKSSSRAAGQNKYTSTGTSLGPVALSLDIFFKAASYSNLVKLSLGVLSAGRDSRSRMISCWVVVNVLVKKSYTRFLQYPPASWEFSRFHRWWGWKVAAMAC